MGNIFRKQKCFYYILNVPKNVGNHDRRIEQLYYSAIGDLKILEIMIIHGTSRIMPNDIDHYHGYLKSSVQITSKNLKAVSLSEYRKEYEKCRFIETTTRVFNFTR
jgi:metallophosphoesterase superfamily enzyme